VRWLRQFLIVLGLLALFLLLFCSQTRPGRAGFKSLLLVPQLIPNASFKPLEWFTIGPHRQEVTFPTASGTGVADIYRIEDGRERAGVILFLGVNPAGRDDTRVVNLGQALARAGFVVMIPWSEKMVQRRLDTDSPGDLVSAFLYLRGRPDVDDRRVGMGGFCVGGSMALVAAADPRIRDDVAFVNSFGGYYDAFDLVVQVAGRTRFFNGNETAWQPSEQTRDVLTTELLEGIEDAHERDLVRELLAQEGGATSRQLEGLSRQGRAVYSLLHGVGLEEARKAAADLPPASLALLDSVSPSAVVGGIGARVLIMHDREDDNVPSEESRRLADALVERGNLRYTEFSFFQHMDPTRRVGIFTFIGEAFKLYRHLYDIVAVAN
jgi:dienelactone hydrolase